MRRDGLYVILAALLKRYGNAVTYTHAELEEVDLRAQFQIEEYSNGGCVLRLVEEKDGKGVPSKTR